VRGPAGTLLPYYLKEDHQWGLDLQELHDQTEKVRGRPARPARGGVGQSPPAPRAVQQRPHAARMRGRARSAPAR
jgi:hypothetical protein